MPRLLLVEDEVVNRDLFRRRLERKGYAVVTAEDGLKAVALTRSEMPDLVLMDLGLPDIDGWEATRRIKADPATAAVPVVVLSAHATTDARNKAFAAGCEEFETKPVNWEALFKKIEEALARARERAAAQATPDDEVDLIGTPEPDPMAVTAVLRKGQRALVDDVRSDESDVCVVQPKRILVAEDNEPNRVLLCRRLNARGFRTTEATDGRQALELVAKVRFDLVLCDIMMPDVDGYEVLKAMKADADLRAIPVIVISARDDAAEVARCIEMGAEDYLQKPYEPALLHARVNACLDKRRLRDQEVAYLRAVADLTRAAEHVEKGTFDPALLAEVAARGDALGTLARVFAKMAHGVQGRERQLRADVQKLATAAGDRREVAPKPGDTLILPLPPK